MKSTRKNKTDVRTWAVRAVAWLIVALLVLSVVWTAVEAIQL